MEVQAVSLPGAQAAQDPHSSLHSPHLALCPCRREGPGPRAQRLRRACLLSLTGLSSSQTCFRSPAPERQVQRLADDLRVHH